MRSAIGPSTSARVGVSIKPLADSCSIIQMMRVWASGNQWRMAWSGSGASQTPGPMYGAASASAARMYALTVARMSAISAIFS